MSDDVVTQFVNESSRRYYDEGVRARTWCRSHTTDTSVEKNAWKHKRKMGTPSRRIFRVIELQITTANLSTDLILIQTTTVK